MIDLKTELLTEDEQVQMRRLEQACIQADKKKEDYYHANHKYIMDALNEVKPPSIFGEKTEPYYTLDDVEEGKELSKDREKKRKRDKGKKKENMKNKKEKEWNLKKK